MNGVPFLGFGNNMSTVVARPMLWIPPGTRFDFFANYSPPIIAHAIGFQLEV